MRIYETILCLSGNKNYSVKNYEKALFYYEKVSKLKNPKVKNLISYGYILLKTGTIEESKKVFDRIFKMSLDVNNKNYAKSIYALIHWKENNLDKAIATLEEVIKVYETTAVYGSLGYLYIEKGDLDAALIFNKKAYEYNSDNSIILDNLVQNYLLLGNFKKAEDIMGQLMMKKPTFPEAYYNYAKLQKAKGHIDEAIGSIDKALEFELSFLSAITREELMSFKNSLLLD